jgi:TrmH family RNA methyltransferase
MTDNKVSSLQHPLIKHLVKLQRDKHYRNQQRRAVLVGSQLITELADIAVFTHLLIGPSGATPAGVEVEQVASVTQPIIEKVAGITTNDPLIAEVVLPNPQSVDQCERLLILDRLQEPGNVGTLLRTALALGWDGVVLIEGSVDPFNDKALRASRGALFRLPYCIGMLADVERLMSSRQLYVADLKGTAAGSFTPARPFMLAMGREASGPSEELLRLGQPIAILMPGAMESLNVAAAGAILMYAL